MMKHILWSFAVCLLGLFVMASLTGCKGPEGPAGPEGEKGEAGTNGTNGLDAGFVSFDGFKDSLQCASCHTPDSDTALFVNARRMEYESAGHVEGTSWTRGLNSTTCASCHATEGYLEMARGGYASMTTKLYANVTAPNCFTCHSPHVNGDFTLRKTTAINIKSFVVGAPDVSFDVGSSNTCVTCHRTRETSPMSPLPDPSKTLATDSITITSNRWYPHYGVQGQIMVGKGGFEFAGYTYPSSYHTTLSNQKILQCESCHMGTITIVDGKPVAGGHTLKLGYLASSTATSRTINVSGCRASGCHSDITSNTMTEANFLAYRSAQTDVEHALDSLATLLANKGWLNTSTGMLNASSTAPLVIKPAYKAGAIFNYYFLEHEGSFGIHNTDYAIALLNASIDELNKP